MPIWQKNPETLFSFRQCFAKNTDLLIIVNTRATSSQPSHQHPCLSHKNSWDFCWQTPPAGKFPCYRGMSRSLELHPYNHHLNISVIDALSDLIAISSVFIIAQAQDNNLKEVADIRALKNLRSTLDKHHVGLQFIHTHTKRQYISDFNIEIIIVKLQNHS